MEDSCTGANTSCTIKSQAFLHCSQCGAEKHSECVRDENNSMLLKGDIFFDFTCSNCSDSGHDELFRSRISWLAAILLSLYNLHLQGIGSKQGYFHWKNNICEFISEHWVLLFGPKCKKKKTWQGVVSGNLSSNIGRLFTSGAGDLNEQGWWKLKSMEHPAILLEKSKSLPPSKKTCVQLENRFMVNGEDMSLIKRQPRHSTSGNSMLNAIALKEKRDALFVAKTATKVKGERKRKLKDEGTKQVNKKTGKCAELITDFDNYWELVKVGDKFVSVPKNSDVVDQLRLNGHVSSNVIITKNVVTQRNGAPTQNGCENSDSEPQKFVKRTFSRAKKIRPPSTVTDTLVPARKELVPNIGTTSRDERIDLSPKVNDYSDTLLFPCFDNLTGEITSHSATLSSTSPTRSLNPLDPEHPLQLSPEPSPHPLSPEPPLHSLSPEPPLNPLVFLPQYELSHLDLGGEVELEENFTEESSEYPGVEEEEEDEFTLAGVDSVSLHPESGDENEFESVGEIEKYQSGDLYEDDSTASAIVDRTSQPSLEEIFGDIVTPRNSEEGIIGPCDDIDLEAVSRDQDSVGESDHPPELPEQDSNHEAVNYESYDPRANCGIKKDTEPEVLEFEAEVESLGADDGSDRVLDRFQTNPRERARLKKILLFSGNYPLLHINSPYSGKRLKPFIRRDFDIIPAKLKVLRDIQSRGDGCTDDHPLDFCYVQPGHIPAVNHLAQHLFWAGIDVSEVLQYPDFSCVVLYRKLVIGFGFLVPDSGWNESYLSYFLVHPDWSRAGIGTYMLYHLIQTSLSKDITLHVSASNPALLLYQKFGFKVEEFVQEFYHKYLTKESTDCRHALYMRLSR